MANKLIRGITIEIGGDTTKLGKALEDTEKSSRSLQSELREIESALKFDPSNVELLAQRQTVLTQNIEETSKKLDILKDAERQVIAQFERGEVAEEQVRALQREVIKCENALSDMESKADGTSKSVDKLGDSAEDAEGGFTIMKGALADLVSNVIQSAISGIGDLVGSLFELSEATEEYRVMQAKLEGSANSFGYSMDFVKGKYEDFYKYLGDDQASTNAITNLLGLGTSTESVAKLAEGAIAVWSAYGDSIPIEGLTEALNETAQVGKVTGGLADALNWAGISEDAFNEKLAEMTTTQERADYIAQVLNETYGESKKTYDELSGSVLDANEAELELKDTQAELGEIMSPVNTAFTDLKNKALEAILPIVKDLATAFMDLLAWLKENPVALTILTGVVIGLATAFGVLATALAIQGLITGVTKAIALLNTTLLANPIVLIVALIAGLVASFIYFWNTSEEFRQFWIDLWETIKHATSVAIEAVVTFFTDAWTWIVETWGLATEWFSNLWLSITEVFSNVVEWFGTTFTNAWNKIVEVWGLVSAWFANLWASIVEIFTPAVEWFSALFSSIYDTLASIVAVIIELARGTWTLITTIFGIAYEWFSTNVIEPVKEAFTKFWNTIRDLASKAWAFISEVFSVVATWFSEKVIEPVRNAFTKFWEKIKSLASSTWSGIKNIWTAVSGWFNSKIITPVSNFFSNMWKKLKSGASDAWSGIKNVFSSVTSWFKDKFSQAWTAVKNVFSSGGKIFSGIKEGIASTFKTVVNGIISGINKVISVPFSTINGALSTIRNISIAGISPFSGLPSISTPQIPLLYRGGILKRGQVGLLEGNGSEAVVPLEKETGWINRIAQKMNEYQANTPVNTELVSKMDEMIRTFKTVKSAIVLDTGVLVGETINQIDAGLSNNYTLRERRV